MSFGLRQSFGRLCKQEELELPEWDETELKPKSKMPDCPRCGEDELGMLHAELTMCYACGFKIGSWISVSKLLS